MTDNPEETAQRIAAQGREALLARLRPAFAQAVSAHADVLMLDEDQVERMVQQAADRADGLQWRRALASIATEELGISLGEALGHPAVVRAQEIIGAPSYERSLAELGISVSAPPSADEPESPDPPQSAEASEPGLTPPEEEVDAGQEVQAPLPGDAEPEVDLAHDAEGEGPDEADEDSASLRLEATHVSGIAALQAGEHGLELRLGAPGLDIARKPDRVIGRLRWQEIDALEVSTPKGLRRRRRPDRANLVIRTGHGDATFEIPAVTEEELRESVEPLVERYGTR